MKVGWKRFWIATDFRRQHKMSLVSVRLDSVHMKWTHEKALLFSERNRIECRVIGRKWYTFVFRKGLD